MTESIKTILLTVYGQQQYAEKTVASGNTITPGAVVKLNSSDEVLNLVGGDEGKNLPILVAIENSLIGETIDDTYAAASRCRVVRLREGDEFYAKVATSNNVTKGDLLALKGTGGDVTLTVTSGHNQIFQALESVDNYPGVASARIKVRVIDTQTVA